MRGRLLSLSTLMTVGLAVPAVADPPSPVSSTDYVTPFAGATYVEDSCVDGSTCVQSPSFDPSGAMSASSSFRRDAADPLTPASGVQKGEYSYSNGRAWVVVKVPKRVSKVTVTASFSGLTGAATAGSTAGAEAGYAGIGLCVDTCDGGNGTYEGLLSAASLYGAPGGNGTTDSVSGATRDLTVTVAPAPKDRFLTLVAYLYSGAYGRSPRVCPAGGDCVAEVPTGHAGSASAQLSGVLTKIHVETS